ncbi:hypothetical protein HNR16_002891 [Pseudoclavibacter chungangensis]|nr:MFS transporter [Pseudoclavibacter chungangensis]NYJ68103.1 hypothetical protein [Pseudoclavibacter chungangensis]
MSSDDAFEERAPYAGVTGGVASARVASTVRAPRTEVPTLLGAQMAFNIGFYAVVPFIAIVLADDFALAGTAVGLVLGVRTFAQQGMFLVGGVLADRFGARTLILVGCGVRVLGFLTLAASLWSPEPALWLFVVGTVLTGLGGALFSPGLNVLIADAESRRGPAGARRRATLFAWLGVTGEVGAVIGPVVGALLLGLGFATVAAAGAGMFVVIGVLLAWLLPRPDATRGRGRGRSRRGRGDPRADARGSHGLGSHGHGGARIDGEPDEGEDPAEHPPARGWAALRDRRFVAFAALHASDLLAYNQLYLALPLALAVVGAGADVVALLFVWVSVLTLGAQLPIARVCARLGDERALRLGYLVTAAGFGLAAASAIVPVSRTAAIIAAFGTATGIILGHLAANPTALGRVHRFAVAGPTGSFFGLLATAGGVAVLIGNVFVGRLFALGAEVTAAAPWPVLGTGAAAAAPWLVLAIPSLLAALLVPRILCGTESRVVATGPAAR